MTRRMADSVDSLGGIIKEYAVKYEKMQKIIEGRVAARSSQAGKPSSQRKDTNSSVIKKSSIST